MKYLLTVLTNGRSQYLDRALGAFREMVTPAPAEIFVMDDGGASGDPGLGRYEASPTSLGMCSAHARCWNEAAASPYEWVFHLEDDFVILRPVRLELMADALVTRPEFKQMALVRTPWGAELEYGGYIPQSPGWYTRETILGARGAHEVISTKRNWATNPALFRTALTREFPWSHNANCESEIGFRMIDVYPDGVFGLWGSGEPWAAHIGVERAAGAHGY